MDEVKKIPCFRCSGQKKMYKIHSAYSLICTGGIEVNCPMCNGEGKVVKLEDISLNDTKKQTKKGQYKNGTRQRTSTI